MEVKSPYELAAEAARARRASDLAAQTAIEQSFARMAEIVPPVLTLIENDSSESIE